METDSENQIVPRAYALAIERRPELLARFESAAKEIESRSGKSILNSFEAILSRGTAAINMSLPRLNQFLKSGYWLNVYEAAALETGLEGLELENTIAARLGEFYASRRYVDKVLRFQRNTHYASLNIGGSGPSDRWGICCIVFGLEHWSPYHTCFAGDTIVTCFDSNGKAVIDENGMLDRFAAGENSYELSVIRHKDYLRRARVALEPREVRALLESADSLVELHLHGAVTRDHVVEVRMSQRDIRHLSDLSDRFTSLTAPHGKEFDKVPHFQEALIHLDKYGIPIVAAEQS